MQAQQARKILTDSEYDLVRSATPRNAAHLTPGQLRSAMSRVRKLRDKSRTLARGQKRATARKTGTAAAGANTKKKLALFEEALANLEARLAEADRPAAPRRAKQAKKKAARRAAAPEPRAAKRARPMKKSRAKAKAAPRAAARPAARAAKPKPPARTARQPRAQREPARPVRTPPKARLVPTRPAPARRLLGAQASPLVSPIPNTGATTLPDLLHTTEIRDLARETYDKETRGPRHENLIAGAANARIRGHASGGGRRAQGRRDAQQRGDKRADMGNVDR